jgi:hypothetical protein
MRQQVSSWLALGDSYTIGEGVPLHDSYPNQTIQLLRKNDYSFHAAEIVAKTGWTSFELAEHLLHHQYNEKYDFVSLLIGVNNQYRGLTVDSYREDLIFLVKKAIQWTGGNPQRVVLLSIPDWGVTPFAADRDKNQIASEIDGFNHILLDAAEQFRVSHIDVTSSTRQSGTDLSFLTSDQLHPSGKEYYTWACLLYEWFLKGFRASGV